MWVPGDGDGERRAEWLARWQQDGDRDALNRLLQSEIGELAQRLRRRIGKGADPASSATDLVQDAVGRWLQMDAPPQFELPEQLRAYLWRSAWNLFLDLARRPAVRLREFSPSGSRTLRQTFARTGGLGQVEQDDLHHALHVAINLLPETDADILERVYVAGQKIERAAVELGLSRAAAEMRLSRARGRLATCLVDWAEVVG